MSFTLFLCDVLQLLQTSGSADQVRALENSLPLRTVRSCQSSGAMASHVDIQAVKLDGVKLGGQQSKPIKYTSSSSSGSQNCQSQDLHDTMEL